MSRSLILLVIGVMVASTASGNVIQSRVPLPDGRIVGGQPTTIQDFPYQVSVRFIGSHICGGSILNARVVVTAAHCLDSPLAILYSVKYGSTNVNMGGHNVIAARLIKHENYSPNTNDYDIGLIILLSEIQFGSTAQPIDLAEVNPAPGTPSIVSGWGTTSEGGTTSSDLQMVNVQIVDSISCNNDYSGINQITDRMLCAGVNGGGKDACQGDSGGPLVADNQLVGIVSWGVGCARPGYPGVYSNVANQRSWVYDNI